MDFVEVFQASLQRISEPSTQARFLDGFYQRFVGSNAAVAEKFHATDMQRQKEMLRQSLEEMCDFCVTHKSNPYILTLARVHGGRGRDIPVAMYDLWLNSLVETVGEVDPEFNPNVAAAWRMVMAPGIEFMKFYRDR